VHPIHFLTLDRYLIREVLRPFAATCALFVLLFGGYSSANLLADAVAGVLPMDIVWKLIGLRIIIALEVLLPIALYLSVVMGLGRLYSESEMTAMAACGYGSGRAAWTGLRLSLMVAAVVACLAIVIRPWAYQQSYVLKNLGQAQFDIDKLEAGRFHLNEETGYVIFAETVDQEHEQLSQVFFTRPGEGKKIQAVYAQSMRQAERQDDRLALEFHDGYAYEIDALGSGDRVLHFQTLTLALAGAPEPLGYKSKAATMAQLWGSDNPKDIAELQWRLLRPVSAFLLACLAVPLSRSTPRRGRQGSTVLAIIVFAVYYNLSGMAKTWVKEGVVGAIPGAWWPDVLLMLVLLAWYLPILTAWWRARRFRFVWENL